MVELSNEIAAMDSLLLAFAAWLRFGAEPALEPFVVATATTQRR